MEKIIHQSASQPSRLGRPSLGRVSLPSMHPGAPPLPSMQHLCAVVTVADQAPTPGGVLSQALPIVESLRQGDGWI